MTVTAGRSTVSSPRENITMTVGEFLLWRIREAGAGHAFGVPGDYNLELLQQFEDTGTLEWIGTCNEPNASYAADGYARLNGMAALIVTNPVGALRAPNDTLILTESLMDPFDAPAGIISGGNVGADLDYGPRGPQYRDNALIRPAT
jgi:hypothetical protein